MSTSIIIDLLIAAIIALNIYSGWKKGIVRGLLTLVGSILAIIVASQIADFSAAFLVEQVIEPSTLAAIEQQVMELDAESIVISPLEGIEQAIDAIENDLVREKAMELLSSVNLPAEILADSAKDTVLTLSGELASTVLHGVVRDILSVVICILCFALLSLALRPVIWTVEKLFQLPLLREVNQLGGLLSGAVKGILLVLIAVWALRLAGLYITDEIITQSVLLKAAVQFLDSLGFGSAPIL